MIFIRRAAGGTGKTDIIHKNADILKKNEYTSMEIKEHD